MLAIPFVPVFFVLLERVCKTCQEIIPKEKPPTD